MTKKAHQVARRSISQIGRILGLSLFCVASVHASSLDCSKVESQVERMICGDPDLKATDFKIASDFDQLRKLVDDKEALTADQRRWLQNVRNRSTSKIEIAIAYKSRTAYLEEWLDQLKGPEGVREFSCPLAPPTRDQDGCELVSKCARDSDGSILEATASQCTPHGKWKGIKVYLHPDSSSPSTLVFSMQDGASTNLVTWNFPDRNGFAELSLVGGCGSGGCSSDLFRYDPEQRTMYPYHGGSTEVDYFDGYLLDHFGNFDHAEIQAHKVRRQGVRDVVEEKMFVIQFDYDDSGSGSCRFLINTKKPPYGHAITPPNDKWYKFCPKSGIPP